MGVMPVQMGVMPVQMGVMPVQMGVMTVQMGVMPVQMGVMPVQMGCHASSNAVVNGSDAPTSCGITYATNFVNLKNLRNFERTVFSYIGGVFGVT
jgi:hypothetical protein